MSIIVVLILYVFLAATIFLALGLIETPHKKILRILMITYFVTVAFLIFFLELLQGREDRMEGECWVLKYIFFLSFKVFLTSEVRVVKKRSNNNDLPMRSTRSRNGGGDPLSFEEEPEEFTYRLPTVCGTQLKKNGLR